MLIRPHPGHSSLAIRMLARKSLACASRCAQSPFPLDFTTSSPELAIVLTPPRVDPLANPVLSLLLQRVRGAGPLPRLHRRGPIEATAAESAVPCKRKLFHGFIAVAPLKLVEHTPNVPAVLALPRLHRRGPIEADVQRSQFTELVVLFHGFIAVAPLKLRQRLPALPRLHRRGPIEAYHSRPS